MQLKENPEFIKNYQISKEKEGGNNNFTTLKKTFQYAVMPSE